MTSPIGCDGCQDELDLFAVSNRDTGQAQFLGPLCLAMFGATMLIATSTEVADAAFKGLGYQPTPATKKARKDAEGPEYDPERVIADLVFVGAPASDDESVSDQSDESADQLVDNSTNAAADIADVTTDDEVAEHEEAMQAARTAANDNPPPY